MSSGRFNSKSEALREGLRRREERLAALDVAIAQGRADIAAGRSKSADEVLKRLDAQYRKLSKSRATIPSAPARSSRSSSRRPSRLAGCPGAIPLSTRGVICVCGDASMEATLSFSTSVPMRSRFSPSSMAHEIMRRSSLPMMKPSDAYKVRVTVSEPPPHTGR